MDISNETNQLKEESFSDHSLQIKCFVRLRSFGNRIRSPEVLNCPFGDRIYPPGEKTLLY